MLRALAALALLVTASPALAQDAGASGDGQPGAEAGSPDEPKPQLGVSVTNDLEIRWWRRPERLADFPDRAVFNYVEQVNRLSVQGQYGPWNAWAQVDQVALFFNRYNLDGNILYERRVAQSGLRTGDGRSFLDVQDAVPLSMPTVGSSFLNLEKIALQWRSPELDVTFGDFYAAFGRGGALNLNRNVDIDIDTSIQGAKLAWRPGDVTVTALAGQLNRQQVFQDNPNILIAPDRRHAIAGVRAEWFGPAILGVHASAVDFAAEEGLSGGLRQLGTTPDVLVAGGTGELTTGPVDWAGEVDVYGFPTGVAWGGAEPCDGEPSVCLGYAGYLSSTVYAGPVSFLVEGKRYKNTERINGPLVNELYEVAILPTLEYEIAITEDSSAALNSNDITAGSLRMDVYALDSLLPYASIMVARDEAQGPLHFNRVDETIVHGMTGMEVIRGDASVIFNLGLRIDDRDGRQWGFDRQAHGDIQAKLPIKGDLFIAPQVNLESFKWGVNVAPDEPQDLQQTDYWEMESSFSIMKGSEIAVTWFTDYTTNPLVNDKGNLGSEDWFGAVEVQVKPSPAWTIKGFFGAYKSGIRCAGGQCRVLPGFNGARLAVVGSL
jgi:hypothetical protein